MIEPTTFNRRHLIAQNDETKNQHQTCLYLAYKDSCGSKQDVGMDNSKEMSSPAANAMAAPNYGKNAELVKILGCQKINIDTYHANIKMQQCKRKIIA